MSDGDRVEGNNRYTTWGGNIRNSKGFKNLTRGKKMRHNTIIKEGIDHNYSNHISFAKKIIGPCSASAHTNSGELSTKVSTPLLPNAQTPGLYSNSKLFLYSPGDDESRLLVNGHKITWAFPYQELNNGGVRR